ncbi:transglutaminase family protein [Nodosilinea sp. E11]|uniref:transglutaminase family protein n=1 Tax=Nodosilinea sp. E11 TaxID=3037479 RepID=UPI0029345AE0|nr:transglutaminase family protein [Nodosilinea sp. E11]WOD38321.1 transglutaminase family protein [Nodosilinea sp. E11]
MRYQIRHLTRYRYQQPVTLRPHTLRLRPRSDGAQQLLSFDLAVTPTPRQQSTITDTDGNATTGLWFASDPGDQLEIVATAEVVTCRTNPFDYLAEPWAATLPIDYPTTLKTVLAPYLDPGEALSPGVVDLAQTIAAEVEGNVGVFLTTLTTKIYQACDYTVRPTGNPWPAGVTWGRRRGSCRDFAVVFMEACRAVGLAARFVSGYEEGDATSLDRDLHAWAEVYVPGGGWRGFDPTHGLAVSDRHIALVASPFPAQTLPISGAIQEGSRVGSTLEAEIRVTVLDD